MFWSCFGTKCRIHRSQVCLHGNLQQQKNKIMETSSQCTEDEAKVICRTKFRKRASFDFFKVIKADSVIKLWRFATPNLGVSRLHPQNMKNQLLTLNTSSWNVLDLSNIYGKKACLISLDIHPGTYAVQTCIMLIEINETETDTVQYDEQQRIFEPNE